jgi:hypothetical protein
MRRRRCCTCRPWIEIALAGAMPSILIDAEVCTLPVAAFSTAPKRERSR